eukprot:TRINITY_DN1086_c0_g3_i1.p1 TRINITY_DN1086_c0_g3~~TRINITY_DN1086_c0_g3_i1.p1  ORF type:complete len:306 (+),score=69.94 TRINITY_DN1086_c0_g3_i1:200-1117(+)
MATESNPESGEQGHQSFEQLDVVCKNVDNIENMLHGVENDKNALEEDMEHLKSDPDSGRNLIKRLQQRVNWEGEELMKNLFRLDEIIIGDSPHYRQVRKSLVLRIQRILSHIDDISHSLILLHDSLPQNLSTEKEDTAKEESNENSTKGEKKEERHDQTVKENVPSPMEEDNEEPIQETKEEAPSPLKDFDLNSQGQYTPKTINIKEDPTFYRVAVKLPGVKKESIDLDIQQYNKMLDLKGPLQLKNGKQVSFSKRFKIPEDVDVSQIQAKMEDSTLEITLPRVPRRRQYNNRDRYRGRWGNNMF